ncbi:MAG: SDR family NAD(P)-dependent oxidoreductase, partial [Candidatus Angelobacter sp.]
MLAEKIELLFPGNEPEESGAPNPARGAVMVFLILMLRGSDTAGFRQQLDRIDSNLSHKITALFIQQGWLAADTGELTVSGKALLEASEFNIAESYRPLLHAMDDLLFGDPARVFDLLGNSRPGYWKTFKPGSLFDDQQQVVAISNEKLREQQFQAVSDFEIVDQQPVNQSLAVRASEQPPYYVNRQGRLLVALAVLTHWQQRFRILAESLTNPSLPVMQAHAVSTTAEENSGHLRFDWLHRLAHEYLISAEAFITLAASVGLFNDDGVKRYPRSSGPCQVSQHNFRKRDYVVRNAAESDLDRLCELERLCWQHTQTPAEQIRARLLEYPQGQFVLEKGGKVLGVIYSQRIADRGALMACNAADVYKLHQPSGAIIQLLAVNIDPNAQNASYGDQLLEFMLQRCSLITGIDQVMGVTLCKKFDPANGQSFEQYIRQQGSYQDPILAFHQSHGAEIIRAIPGYRPQDRGNQGNGVLVSYDILNRKPQCQQCSAEAASGTGADLNLDEQQVRQFVQEKAAKLLGVSTSALQSGRPLMEMGLDSADLLQLQRQLEEKFRLELQTGFFFEHSNIQKVVEHFIARLVRHPEIDRPSSAAQVSGTQNANYNTGKAGDPEPSRNHFSESDIAIIGMSCKLPGGIETPDQLWQALAAKKSVIGTFPKTRRSWPSSSDLPAIDQGGFVSDVEAFDASFFRISRAEAEITDPQQRILLQLGWACLEDAGILPDSLKGSNSGVFVGASNCDYSRLILEAGLEVEAHHAIGSSLAILANRISYFFDFSGPSLLIDTACSSSLVALHAAIQSLRSGECATALVGGANVICQPDLSVAYHKAGMLARDGRCKVFDAKADGYVRSEGAVMLLLKPLSAAVIEGDQIHAVIKGSAINHGGLAAGLTVPNPQKQKDLLVAAWKDAGIAAHDLTHIEAHGTGTSLGDPIEIQGIQAAYTQLAEKGLDKPCAIASVKSNLGHLESAAGITGLLKTILSLQHRQIPASIHCEQLNPKIHLNDTPFFIPDQLREWDAEGTRAAGVSSFGSGGANAHVVVEEYPPQIQQHRQEGAEFLFVLSAATHELLRLYAMRVMDWLEKDSAEAEFADAIYTWQTGRTAMNQRLAIRVKDRTELLGKLRQWLACNNDVADLWFGQVQKSSSINRVWQTQSGRQLVDRAMLDGDLEQIGILWTTGLELDWNRFYESTQLREGKPRRISLPTYPFAKERYWIDTSKKKETGTSGAFAGELHPLLHRNTSTFNELRFSTEFSGDEFFLRDHRVKGAKVLPGVCYLEMARAALMALAKGEESNEASAVHLKNVVWLSPIIVEAPQRLHIRMYPAANDEIEFEIYSNVAGVASSEESENIHGKGTAFLGAGKVSADDQRLDWQALKAQCNQTIEAEQCYAAFRAMEIEYGPGHRGIRSVALGQNSKGERYALAEAGLPECLSMMLHQYVLHPSVLDCALQAAMGWALSFQANETVRANLPFALEEIEILDSTPEQAYVYVREKRDAEPGKHSRTARVQKSDIDICDESGRICVRLKGFTSRVLENDFKKGEKPSATAPKDESQIVTMPMVAVWDATIPPAALPWPSAESRVLLVGGTAEEKEAIKSRYSDVSTMPPNADDLKDWIERVHMQVPIEHVIWVVPASNAMDIADECLIVAQSEGVLTGLRLIKAFLDLGYGQRDLGWTIVTRQTQAIRRDEHIQPAHASVHGLVGSLAKEYVRWKIRLIDLPLTSEWPLEEIIALPADAQGDAWGYRAGEWYRRQLIPCEFPVAQTLPHRQGGVYVIIGGAGGIGEVFSEHLIRNYAAQVVWIGRRELNGEIQAKLDRLSAIGPAPLYVRADATDREELARACEIIHAKFERIHGLVHAAIALADRSLAQMDEERFRVSLAAKADISVRIAQVFAHERLDWVLFFSSFLSFLKPAGQSNYVAGSTFEDSFAYQLSKAWSCPVKVMNWGYWGSRGIVASDAYRTRMAQNGIGSIEPEEGMAALGQLLSVPVQQIALVKAQLRVVEGMALLQDTINLAAEHLPAAKNALTPHTSHVFVSAFDNPDSESDMQRLMGLLLFEQLRKLGLFNEGQGPAIARKQHQGILNLYDRWFDETMRLLASEGHISVADGSYVATGQSMPHGMALWSEWEAKKGEWLKDANLGANMKLVDTTLRALPEILTGKRRATDVLFPNASMELVEGFYKNNPPADYFNAVLADAVIEFIEQRGRQDANARFRIIEIGAGTGGTSEVVFKRLQGFVDCIDEYCYTDVSKAFLMYAEQSYGAAIPYLNCRLFNVEQPLEPQGIIPGTYDLAIATNVLHATRNIRNTLRNSKALLKQNGLLLLNELLGPSLLTHLTFGLLEGWWLYEDAPVRIPGTPTLAPETWQRILEDEGFHNILFPAVQSHKRGQQVIVVQSDGVIRQSQKKNPAQLSNKKEAPKSVALKQIGPVSAENADAEWVHDRATALFKKIVGQTLKLPVHEIDSREELEKYGIDSIMIVSMVDALRSVFAGITSTVFFEHRTIDTLVKHFIATEEEAVRRWAGLSAPDPLETQILTGRSLRAQTPSPIKKTAGRRHLPTADVDLRSSEDEAGPGPARVDDIAIIGLSGRYPEAANLEEYWRNLSEGKDCIREVPKERWDWKEY